MTDWKQAITYRKELDADCRKTFVGNEQVRLGGDSVLLKADHPQAGSIAYTFQTCRYTVTNDHTFASRLSEEEVEQAMADLDVANRDWR